MPTEDKPGLFPPPPPADGLFCLPAKPSFFSTRDNGSSREATGTELALKAVVFTPWNE